MPVSSAVQPASEPPGHSARAEHQLDLLSDTPIARGSDPSTSHQAAAAVTACGSRAEQQHAVFAMLRRRPGLTSAELADAERVDRYMPARRLPELREADPPLVKNGEQRVCRVTKRRALTWWPA